MFKQAGQFEGKILDTMIAEPKFAQNDPNAFDVCLRVEGPEGQSDWWHGEMSTKLGKGNFANRTQAQITMGDLRKIGFEGDDLTTLDAQMKGKTIPFTVDAREYDGKTYYDVKYIGGPSYGPKPLDAAAAAARMAAFSTGLASTGASGQTQPAQPAQQAQSTNDDPWG